MIVYDPKGFWDDSGELRVKYLYWHFPEKIEILEILVFDRTKKMNKPYYHRIGPNIFENSRYLRAFHALVYTRGSIQTIIKSLIQMNFSIIEKFGDKWYYFRHYMRSERHNYTEEGKTFFSLDWFFDENIHFCTKLDKEVTALVFLRMETELNYILDESELNMYFAEFYGLTHKVLKITFPSVRGDTYTIEEVNRSEANNAYTFIHCEPHPAFVNPTPIKCVDYKDDSPALLLSQFYGSDSDQSFV